MERSLLVEEGLAIMRSSGLEAVTMRRVAAAMTWAPSALYRYVEGRDDLLVAMTERVLSRVRVPEPEPEAWRHQLVRLVTDCRRALDRYPGLARLVLVQLPSSAPAVAIAHAALQCLREGGATDERARHIAELLFLFVTATSTAETGYEAEGRWGDRGDDFMEGLGAKVPLGGTRDDRFAAELGLLLDSIGLPSHPATVRA